MRESQYTAAVKRLLPPAVYALKLSLPYTAGVPDSWYSGPSADLWVEWKYRARIPRSVDLTGGKKPTITRLQQDWLVERHEQGRHVAVIVGSPAGGVIYDRLSWQEVLTKSQFVARAISKRQIASWIASQI